MKKEKSEAANIPSYVRFFRVFLTPNESSVVGCLVTKCVRVFATPWTVAHHAPVSMGFSRQEYWGRLPFLSPGDLPNPGI